MAFEGLTEKISSAFKHLRSKGRLTESDIKEAMREIRMALLEADVNFKVAKDFIKAVTEKATDAEILESLSPSQQVIKIVNEELVALLGGQTTRLTISPNPPTIVMMAGLQGAGKTTNCAKLAALLRKQQQRRPLLVACDVYRPAAIEQLKVVGRQLNIPVFDEGQGDPVEIAKHGIDFARKNGYDLVFLDTAGRLHIDEKLMDELKNIKATVKPTEIILVVDAMTGQDAVTVAQTFDEALGIDGVLMSKMDGDARGGAALSVKAVTGKPIKFIGTGEKLDGFDTFNPEAMASRILGMGDIVALVRDVTSNIDAEKAKKIADRVRKSGRLDLNDFREQMIQMRGMGSMSSLIDKLPAAMQEAAAKQNVSDADADRMIRRTIGIIDSMTPAERHHPELIKASRKRRIAAGAGLPVQEVNKLLKQYDQMTEVMKRMKKGGLSKLLRMAGGRFPGMGGGFPGFGGGRPF